MQRLLAGVYVKCGRLAEGATLCEKVAARFPKNMDLRIGIFDCYRDMQRWEEMSRLTEQAVRDFPGNSRAVGIRGVGKYFTGDLVGGEADLRKALQIEPDLFFAVKHLVRDLEAQGRADEALEVLRQSVERQGGKSHEDVVNHYTQRLRLRGRLAEAEAVCLASLANEPKPSIFLELAKILRAEGRVDDATRTLRDALAKFPRSIQLRGELARVLKAAGRNEEAGGVIRGAGSARRLQPRELVEIALMYKDLKDYEAAVAAARKALAVLPQDPDAMNCLALSLGGLKRYDEAIETATAALKAGGDQAAARVARGIARLNAGDKAGAREDIKLAILRGTNDPQAWCVLGVTQHGEEAVQTLTKAVNMSPEDASYRGRLGAALHDVTRLDEATKQFRMAVTLDPDEPMYRTHLARVLLTAGNLKEGLEVARAAATRFPENYDVQFKLAGACDDAGDVRGAWDATRAALRIRPDAAHALQNMVIYQLRRGRMPEALDLMHRATAIAPADAAEARVHILLLRDCGDAAGAERAAEDATKRFADTFAGWQRLSDFRTAAGDPARGEAVAREGIEKSGESWVMLRCLAMALLAQGKIDEAAEAFEQAQNDAESLAKDDSLRDPAEEYAEFKRRADLRPRLAAIAAGKPRPTPQDLLDAAYVYSWRSDFGAATRLFVQAFQADPSFALDDGKWKRNRFEAICAAARAAGSGDSATRNLGRARALEWLRAAYDEEAKRLAGGDADAARKVASQLRSWTTDRNLAAVRGDTAFASMPAAEQGPWKSLWADVAKSLAEAQTKGREEEP